MNVLVLGASGFIGNAVFHALLSKHSVKIAGRTPLDGYDNWAHLDFTIENDWSGVLDDIDLVINAIGIIGGDFEQVQTKGPISLFEACISRNIKILNISAVGAEKGNTKTAFLDSKRVTDDYVLDYKHGRVVYPGIVIGRNGKSSQFFAAISKMPIIPLLKEDSPFVHISQLTKAISEIVDDFDSQEKQIFVTSEKEDLKDILKAMNGGSGIFVPLPSFIFKIFFGIFPSASLGIFNKDTLKLQSIIKSSDYTPRFEKASGLIDSNNVIASDVFVRAFALFAVMFIFVWSGVSSLVSWDASMGLMQEIGADEAISSIVIYLGVAADIVLGLAIYLRKYRKKVIIAQVLFVLTYMVILTVLAPHYWMDPLGVLSKNVPLLALSYYLYESEA